MAAVWSERGVAVGPRGGWGPRGRYGVGQREPLAEEPLDPLDDPLPDVPLDVPETLDVEEPLDVDDPAEVEPPGLQVSLELVEPEPLDEPDEPVPDAPEPPEPLV